MMYEVEPFIIDRILTATILFDKTIDILITGVFCTKLIKRFNFD